MSAEERVQRLEEQKVSLDYIKHVSTLATSVIVFSLAFVKDLEASEWQWLIVPGLGGQLVCLVSLVLAALGVIHAGRSAQPPSERIVAFTLRSSILGLFAFLAGIASLSVYLIVNLL